MSETSDISDIATEREILDREIALEHQRELAARNALKPNGFCYNCSSCLPSGELFCPPEPEGSCRQDYYYRREIRSAQFMEY